jgi:hypothetical protein
MQSTEIERQSKGRHGVLFFGKRSRFVHRQAKKEKEKSRVQRVE